MKKYGMVRVKSHLGKSIFMLSLVFISGYILACWISMWFSKYTVKNVWNTCFIISSISCWIVYMLIVNILVIKNNYRKYKIYYFEKRVSINEKEMCFKNLEYSQSFLQKLFGVVTIKFWNEEEKMIFKNVEKDVLLYFI